ncbi:ribbon-helix-helix protein, CopG family [Gracilibacillus saliphilus]|nr:ribbon-helix-helix protein, CopG family [Gracilibacillus saliphilus]
MSNRRFTLRISEEVFQAIKKEADDNKRSTSAHIEYILEQYIQKKEND